MYSVIAVMFHLVVTVFSYQYLEHRITVVCMMGAMIVVVSQLFYVNWLQALYSGSLYIFSLYSSRGMICSLFSIVLGISFPEVLTNVVYYEWVFFLSILVSILIIHFARLMIVTDEKAKQAFYNMGQLQFVVVYILFQLVFLMIVNDGRSYNLAQLWYSYLYLVACISSKLYLEFVFHHAAKVSELLEVELHTNKLKEQLDRQMHHYQSYQRFTESYRIFRHDYEKLMGSVKMLLNRREYEKAVRMLDDIHCTMQKEVLVHHTYSDHVLLDAILQDSANTAEALNIRFSAHAFLPSDTSATDMDIVCIFTNAVDNAIEACSRQTGGERFIEITSKGTKEWALIEIVNSFDGKLITSGGELKTRKENKISHGFGLHIIKRTVEGLGGLLYMEPELDKQCFKIKIFLPRHMD